MNVEETVRCLTGHVDDFIYSTRLIAAWAIVVPELEAKILFGRHIYHESQAVSVLSQRLEELQRGIPLSEVTQRWDVPRLLRIGADASTARKLHYLYQVFKRRLVERLESHVAGVHRVLDQPTAEVLRGIAAAQRQQIAEATELLEHCVDIPLASTECAGAEGDLFADTPGEPAPYRPARDECLQRRGRSPRVDLTATPILEARDALLHFNLLDLEIPTIEACSRCILDFPAMPWAFVSDMGRQCWDEARHAEAFLNRYVELGGVVGAFTHGKHLWDWADEQPLEVRLCVHQRIGEWLGVAAAEWNSREFRRHGDPATAQIFEFVVCDEITHVALGNKWIYWLCGNEEAAVDRVHQRALQIRSLRNGQPSHSFEKGPLLGPFNKEACVHAGFSGETVQHLERQYCEHGSVLR